MNKRIIAVHLLNDRSGSPLVFKQALEVLSQDHEIILFTATPGGDGFLSDLKGIKHKELFYKWHRNKVYTLVFFILSQVLLFISLLRTLKPTDIAYINTLLPFGAALAAWIRGSTVVYHIHEVSLRPAILKKMLHAIAEHTATRIIFVSAYVAGHYAFSRPKTHTIYNSLPDTFIEATADIPRLNLSRPFTVTMLCSLRAYKGVHQFINIARTLPQLNFELVLNASDKDVVCFIEDVTPPENCHVFAAQKDTADFYRRAHIIMNLSLPDAWIETFGMTILEAMHCGRPVICPPIGGVLELVTHTEQGYTIDSRDEKTVGNLLDTLSRDFRLYKEMSASSGRRAAFFSALAFQQQLCCVFNLENSANRKKDTTTFHKMETI